MTPEEEERYVAYWRQGIGTSQMDTVNDKKLEVITGEHNTINTRQRLQAPPGTRSIVDVKYSKKSDNIYYRETIFDKFGRYIGNNDFTDHKKPWIPEHTIPHHHVNDSTKKGSRHSGPISGLHPSTLLREWCLKLFNIN